MRSKKTIEIFFIKGLKNFDNYENLNYVELKIDANKVLLN